MGVASIGIGTILDRKILEANDEICRILGYERSDLIGKDVRMFYLSDDDLEIAGREIYNNLKGQSISNVGQKLKRTDGQAIDVLMSFTPIDPSDVSKGYTFTMQDITGILLAERIGEEKKERHIRSIFQATPTGIGVTWDRRLLDVNEKMCQIVGRSKEELTGASTRILYPTTEEYERVGRELEVLIDKKEPGVIESRWVNKDGDIRDVYMTFALIDIDNPSTGLTFTVQDVTERKLAEEKIYKLNQFQQTVIESADVWINVFNKDDEVVVWNNAAESISGYSKEDVIGNSRIWESLYPDEAYFKEIVDANKAIFEDGKNISDLETTITRKDGDRRIISWNSRGIFDEHQNVVGSIVIGIDITKQKEAEGTIKQQVHFMQELIDAIPAPIFYKDTDNIYLGCNNAFAEFTGIPKEKMIGKGVYELYEKEIANKYHKMNQELLEKGGTQTYEYYLQSSSGQKRVVIFNNSVFTDIDGNTAGQIGVVFDITERKMAEDALKKHAHFIQELLETVPAPVYYKDKDGAYLGCNRAFEIFSGTKREDLIGKVADDIYDDYQAEEYKRMDNELIKNRGTQTYESEVVYAGDNTKRNVIFNKSVFTDMKDNVSGIIGVILDITERVRSEKLLREYSQQLENSNELKSIFTDVMRHDLLNNVTVIAGYNSLLISSEDDGKKLEWLDKMDLSTKKLAELIESAASLAKLESTEELEFGPIDIGNMLCEIIGDFEYQAGCKGSDIKFVSEGTFVALANPVIEEVFSNYISNALKYGSDTGDIKIDIEDAGDKWKVKFTDSGDGVPDEYKSLIFERFKRVGNIAIQGSGLGLAIVKKIADLHSGEVGVEDNPEGHGSVFWVTLRKA